MALVPFNPPPGLNSDDSTFAAEGRWADGSNVRFWNGKAQPIGAWSSAPFPHTPLTGAPRALFAMVGASSAAIVAVGTTSRLYTLDSGLSVVTNITPAGFATASFWSLAAWGSYLLAVPSSVSVAGKGTLYEYTGSGVATVIANAPDNITAMLVTRRQVLVFGCNEEVSGAFNGRCIRGCDFEDNTDWTSTATNSVFEDIIDDPSEIVGARMVGDYPVFWTKTSVWYGEFIGDPAQIWRWTRAAQGVGLLGINAVAVKGNSAFWLTPNLTWIRWTLGAEPEAVPCPIGKEFAVNFGLNAPEQTCAFYHTAFDEIWLFYDDGRDSGTTNSRYVAFSLRDGAWFRGILARTAVMDTRGVFVRDGSGSHPPSSMIAATAAGQVHFHEQIYSEATVGWYIQSADQYIDQSQRRVMIRGIIPDFEDRAGSTIELTLNVRDRPMSTATAKGPYSLALAATKKDFRASGKITSVKFASASGVQAYARFGKCLFDVVPMGER